MIKKIIVLTCLFTTSVFAVGPSVECRFAAMEKDGVVTLDEVVPYTLLPGTGVTGEFDPYAFELAVYGEILTVDIYLNDDVISTTEIPVWNIASLPLGASVFGINTVFHKPTRGFVSVKYECKKLLD